MSRLDTERQKELEPKRMEYAIKKLSSIITIFNYSNNEIQFYWKDELVRYFPYTGWASGKSIKDGRGLKNLINQLK